MAIRTALGAPASQLIALTARQGTAPVVIGAAAGLAAAWFASALLQSFLFQMTTHDVRVYVAGFILTVLVGGAACLLPARRLTGLAPAKVLRE